MNREEILSIALKDIDKCKCMILELATGTGKTRIAINLMNHICNKAKENPRILILVAKSIHKQEWKREIEKWGGISSTNIIMECYESLKKYQNESFDIVCADEIHHLSDARKDILKSINIKHNLIGLSATLPKSTKDWIKTNYNTTIVSVTLSNAIDDNILPNPVIYKMPLHFDCIPTEYIIKNAGQGLPIVICTWYERWNYLRRKDIELHIQCTKLQYLENLNSEIEWYKKQTMNGRSWAKTKWMRLCNDRLKWLSECKNTYILLMLDKFKNYRTITFCSSIEQSKLLGKNCINSKNSLSQDIINRFNDKKIKHITSVNMVNEGCNLTDCRIGILVNINASEIITNQRYGRLLRHKSPIIIIPYFVNTREEELVNKHLENYNQDLIKTIENINDIKL